MERTLIFDGECGFCTRAAQWAIDHAREPFAAVPYQATSPDRYGLTVDQARERVWWIEDNVQLDGHRAVGRILRACRGPWPVLGRAIATPPLSWAAVVGYELVSRVRHRLPGTRPAVKGGWDPWAGRRTGQPADAARAHP